ncbi:MAG: toxin-antitoxin system YwqK family antitoxin [Bacteroidales bacterium]
MIKKIILMGALVGSVFVSTAQNRRVTLIDGLYYTDGTQSSLYSGELREFFPDSTLRLEMSIKDGKPQGSYVVYHENGKPHEVRAYRNGLFHGIWRTYNEAGMLVAEAEYRDNLKHGTWRVWDDNGVMRYETHYTKGKKSGTWLMWDEKGKLISEKSY